MNRRAFLQKSSLIMPGLGVAGILGSMPRKLFAEPVKMGSLSLSIVSDQPDKAVAMVQQLLNRSKLAQRHIHYTEYVLHGNHMADIAFTHSGQLIDFHHQDGPLLGELLKIAKHLNFPHSCNNPVLSHFSIENGIQKPSGIQVFKNNQLILEKAFPEKTETVAIDAPKGRIVLEVTSDHSVQFVETSCKHKTCMNMGKINQAGQNLVCIPNQISVAIAGTDISGVDSITF